MCLFVNFSLVKTFKFATLAELTRRSHGNLIGVLFGINCTVFDQSELSQLLSDSGPSVRCGSFIYDSWISTQDLLSATNISASFMVRVA